MNADSLCFLPSLYRFQLVYDRAIKDAVKDCAPRIPPLKLYSEHLLLSGD